MKRSIIALSLLLATLACGDICHAWGPSVALSEPTTAAVRQDADTVRLTVAGSLDGALTVRYLYGRNPAVSAPLMGNEDIPLPFEDNGAIPEV